MTSAQYIPQINKHPINQSINQIEKSNERSSRKRGGGLRSVRGQSGIPSSLSPPHPRGKSHPSILLTLQPHYIPFPLGGNGDDGNDGEGTFPLILLPLQEGEGQGEAPSPPSPSILVDGLMNVDALFWIISISIRWKWRCLPPLPLPFIGREFPIKFPRRPIPFPLERRGLCHLPLDPSREGSLPPHPFLFSRGRGNSSSSSPPMEMGVEMVVM